jgi:hypothetical protein
MVLGVFQIGGKDPAVVVPILLSVIRRVFQSNSEAEEVLSLRFGNMSESLLGMGYFLRRFVTGRA